MTLALKLPMAPVRYLNEETPFKGPAWDMALAPTISQRAKNGKHSRLGERISESPDSDSGPSSPELKFVTTTGPPSERSKESRLVVRSHAMQAFLREKKLDGKASTKKEPDVQVKSLDEAIGRFKLASWSRKSSKKTSSAAKNESTPKQVGSDNVAKASAGRPRALEPIPSPVRATSRYYGLVLLTKYTAICAWTTRPFWNHTNRSHASNTEPTSTL
jgi:hypothetical protein